jgi:hypothetical protein
LLNVTEPPAAAEHAFVVFWGDVIGLDADFLVTKFGINDQLRKAAFVAMGLSDIVIRKGGANGAVGRVISYQNQQKPVRAYLSHPPPPLFGNRLKPPRNVFDASPLGFC